MNYHIIIDLLIYLFGFLEFIFVGECLSYVDQAGPKFAV